MEKRSLFSRIFGNNESTKEPNNSTEFKLLDGNKAVFTPYKGDLQNDIDYISCIDAIARNGAKLHPRHIRNYAKTNPDGTKTEKMEDLKDSIYKIVAEQPNELQNGYKFLYNVIYNLKRYNDSMVYVQRDENLKVTGLYPLQFTEGKLYEYQGKLWVKFRFGRSKERFVLYDNCIHLTSYTSKDGLFGGSTLPIVKAMSVKHVIDEGVINAIKTTQSIRGVIKSTQTILKTADVKKMRDQFVKDFINSGDKSGIGGLDGSTEFTPIKLEPVTATDSQIKSVDNKVLNYFGLNENILQSKYSEDEWNAFYESVLEPIAIQMSLEFSNKIFTPTEKGFGNKILFESNALQYASNSTKIGLVRYANNIMTINEQREVFNLAPIEGGDVIMQDVNHNIMQDSDEGGNENEGN